MSRSIKTYNLNDVPVPLGNYSHAAMYGDLIFVCGVASRDPKTNEVPGLVYGPDGRPYKNDIKKETRGTLENLQAILKGVGSSLEKVLEVNVFLTNMDDFKGMNEVYGEYFATHQPVRTTLGVNQLPGDICVEMKAVAVRG